MNTAITRFLIIVAAVAMAIGCSKNASGPASGTATNVLLYGDTLFYLNGQNNQVINPVNSRSGTYSVFPDGLDLNPSSGAITLSTSESGLKYVVMFIPANSVDTEYTFITLSGISYTDGFYNINNGDSIVQPIYNVATTTIPGIGNKSQFDVGGGCNSNGCNVLPGNGKINIAQTVRNGIFGTDPVNGLSREFELEYKLDDKSGQCKNKLTIKLFYFKTMADVTAEATNIIASRQGAFLTSFTNAIPVAALNPKAGKPRPPCIFIVGH